MVAASKMRKAQQAAIAARPFARLLYQIQRKRDDQAGGLQRSAAGSPRGTEACGDSRRRRQRPLRRAQHATSSGWRASSIRTRRCSLPPAARRHSSSPSHGGGSSPNSPTAMHPTTPEARAIAALARELFLSGEVDQVHIVATRFVNTLDARAGRPSRYLPVGEIKGLRIASVQEAERVALDRSECLFEPSAEAVLELPARPLSQHLRLLRAAERQGERTERAHGVDEERHRQRRDLINDLKLEYNKLRQGNITKELLEIAGGQAEMSTSRPMNTGKVVQVVGSGRGRGVSRTRCPPIYNALKVRLHGRETSRSR